MASSLGGVTIPDDLIWTDEFKWSGVTQKQELTLSGAIIIQEAYQARGRPITLEGYDDRAWITKTQLVALRTLSQTPSVSHTLILADGRSFTVVFDRKGGTPLKAQQLLRGDDDNFILDQILLMEV